MKESRKEFIKKAHSHACDLYKSRIEKEFPKLFKKEEGNGWYKSKEVKCWCVFLENGISIYGIDSFGDWFEGQKYNYQLEKDDYKATNKEAEEALIKEANKIGYKNVNIKNLESIDNMLSTHHSSVSSDRYYYNVSENALWFMGRLIFWNGKWAEIIKETITKEQAEKELGKTILN